jgi:hypothetical protein
VKQPAPDLRVIPASAAAVPAPPKGIGPTGAALWQDILSEFTFDNRASLETLAQACRAADRAESCRIQIEADGVVIRTKTGLRDHPLIKHEIQARALYVRLLARLGCDLEPVRDRPGRPSGR